MDKITQAQERFSDLDCVPLGICVLQSDFCVLFWNCCLEEWTKIPRENILGTVISEQFPHFNLPQYSNRLQQIFQGGPPTLFSSQLHKYIIPSPLPQGGWRIQHTTVTCVPALDKVGFYALLSIQDVTDLTLRVQEYRNLRDAALEAARIKSQFLANMSHEIRTPMNGVLGMAELLLKTNLTPQQHDFAQIIGNSANHLLTIVNDILDFSKLEAGEMHLQSLEFDLNDCLGTVIDVLSPQAEVKGLKLAVLIDSQGSKLQGDPVRLRQILLNLIGNAIKFTDEGEVIVQVKSLEPVIPKEEILSPIVRLSFSVRDTGIGISPEGQEKLFQSFTQVDASTTRQYGGTGLGLAICKQLVEQMKGEIGVESKLGEGSEFWFTAEFIQPTAQEHLVDSYESSLSEDTQKFQDDNKLLTTDNKLKILIAEDNLINQQVIVNQLQILGYEGNCAVNGSEALAMLAEHDYDLVLMDCQMPVLDGYAATQELRRTEGSDRHTIVIALTANAMPADREKCLAAGMDDYISKPISLDSLQALLQRWVGARKRTGGVFTSPASPASPALETTPVNLKRLSEITRGNTARQRRLLEIFIQSTEADLEEIKNAIAAGDCLTLEQKAHRLKGSSANVGVPFMSAVAAELELSSREKTICKADSLLSAIDIHLNKVRAFVQTHFPD